MLSSYPECDAAEVRELVRAWLDRHAIETESVSPDGWPPLLKAACRIGDRRMPAGLCEAEGDGRPWLLWWRIDSYQGALRSCLTRPLSERLAGLAPDRLEDLRNGRVRLILDWAHEGVVYLPFCRYLDQQLHEQRIPSSSVILLTQNRTDHERIFSRLFPGEAPFAAVNAHAHAANYWQLLHTDQDAGQADRRVGFALDGPSLRPYRYVCLNYHLRASRAIVVARLLDRAESGWLSFSVRRQRQQNPSIERVLDDVVRLSRPADASRNMEMVRRLLEADMHLETDTASFANPSDGVYSMPAEAFRGAELYIVTETEMSPPFLERYTEKTLKAFIAGIPFVVFGNRGTIDAMRQIGFDTLDDFVDHGYDVIDDPAERLAAAWAQVERFFARQPGFSCDEMDRLRAAAQHNRGVFERRLPQAALLDPLRRIDEAIARVAPTMSRAVPEGWTIASKDHASPPLVTVAVPSFDQGRYLDEALRSIFEQGLPVEVFVADGGSRDGALDVIRHWEHRLAGWRCAPDDGQAAAINEAIALGSAPFVCWLNSDDYLLPGGLAKMLAALVDNPSAPVAYGNVLNRCGEQTAPVRVEGFDVGRLAVHCIISQPGTLIRRTAWEAVEGVRDHLELAFDYDLWWRLYHHGGPFVHVAQTVAVNRDHPFTKTNSRRAQHYREAIAVVREHYGRVPVKWYLAQPYAVWWRSLSTRVRRLLASAHP